MLHNDNCFAVKILLTGATGFLGRHVTRTLAQSGHELAIMHRKSSDVEPVRRYASRLIAADITDPVESVKAAAGNDAIVHMAADLSHWHARRDRVMRTNVMGTRVMVEAAKTAGVPTFLHTSSIAAVGYSADGVPIDEAAPYNFADLHLLYNDSKREAEAEALDAERYGVRVVIVNPGVLYGPRSLTHPFGHTMLELAAGRIPGHPTGGISVTDVQDAALGIAAALERGRGGERYLLTGRNVSYGELFHLQAELVGATYRGRTLPGYALSVAARLFELRSRLDRSEPRLTTDNAKIGALFMYYTSAKATRELGYSNRPLDATLERMVRAYREAGALP